MYTYIYIYIYIYIYVYIYIYIYILTGFKASKPYLFTLDFTGSFFGKK